MKILKLALISVGIFFFFFAGIAFLIPSSIRISKVVDISCTPASLMEQISEPANWKNWHPGLETSPFLYVNGKVEGYILLNNQKQFLIISEKKEKEIISKLKFNKKEIISGWRIVTVNDAGSIGLQWYMDFELGWLPWEKFASLFFENIYGSQMEKGLNRLKAILET